MLQYNYTAQETKEKGIKESKGEWKNKKRKKKKKMGKMQVKRVH